jgi:hypothetical protein
MPSQLQILITNMNNRRHNLRLWAEDVQAVSQAILYNQKLKDFDHNNRLPFITDDAAHGYSVGSSRSYTDPETGIKVFYLCFSNENGNADWRAIIDSGNNAAIENTTGEEGLGHFTLDGTFILD